MLQIFNKGPVLANLITLQLPVDNVLKAFPLSVTPYRILFTLWGPVDRWLEATLKDTENLRAYPTADGHWLLRSYRLPEETKIDLLYLSPVL